MNTQDAHQGSQKEVSGFRCEHGARSEGGMLR